MEPENPDVIIAGATYQPDPVIRHRATLIAFVGAVKSNTPLRETFDRLVTAVLTRQDVDACKHELHCELLKHFLPDGYYETYTQGSTIRPRLKPCSTIDMVHAMMPTIVSELSQWRNDNPSGTPEDALRYIDEKSGFRQLVLSTTGESAHQSR